MSDNNEMTPDMRRRIELGMETEHFLESNVGKFLTDRAEALVEENLGALTDVNAEDPIAIRTLQNNVRVGTLIQSWLADAVNDGWAAENEFANAPPDTTGS